MFENYNGGIAGDATGFKYQITGKAVGNFNYALTSPIYGASPGLFMWKELVTGGAWSNSSERILKYPPKGISIEARAINHSVIMDIRGNAHRRYDNVRRSFTLDYSGVYANAETIRELAALLRESGSIRMFPVGTNGNLYKNAITGQFSSTTGILTPISTTGVPMIAHNWAGWWVEIAGEEFYIEGNDENSLTLVDKIGLGFPSTGIVAFAVRSILVIYNAESTVFNQPNGTMFTRGGQWAEKFPGETEAFEWESASIVFDEIEDLEESG
jgi:hypothetical protein